MLSLVCAAILQTATQAPFSRPVAVPELNRLAMTPKIDGKIDPDEWDPLTSSDNVKTFLEWEPGMLYLAAKLPLNQDLVFSLDREADGWLIGNDNLEIRVSLKDGKPVITARGLNGTGTEGPHWFETPGWAKAATISASFETGAWTFELALQDPGVSLLPGNPSAMGVRIDTLPTDNPPTEAFLPRAMTKIFNVFDRAAGLPEGLTWKPEIKFRSIVPGDTFRMRNTFQGNNDLKIRRIEMRTEGDARDFTTSQGNPFPEFDRKNRAYVDYVTKMEKGLRNGWFVQRSTATTADGISAIMQSCFRSAPLLDFDMPREIINTKPEKRVLRFSILLRSNSINRLDGVLVIVPPNGWRVMRGSDRSFIIPTPRAVSRKTFELEIPAKATGVFPITFRADIGGKMLEGTEWLNIVDAG